MTRGMANRANDGGLIAALLFQCGLDALIRSGPFGRLIGGVIGCIAVIVGIVYVIIYLANTDFSDDTSSPSSSNSTYAKGEEHTPHDTSAESGWTTFILIFGFLFIASMPAFIYVPRYMWRPERQTQPALVQGTPIVPGKPVSEAYDQLPLLAFRVEGEQGEFV